MPLKTFPTTIPPKRERSPLVRVDVSNGQITPLGAHGLWPRLSPDGKMLYFVTNRREGLARILTAGGMEESLLQRVRSLYAYAVGSRSVYLFRDPPGDHSGLATQFVRFDLEFAGSYDIGRDSVSSSIRALSKDERFLYFDQQDDPKRRAVMVRGLF
jgi:WD40 repeat protein